jgi:serine protease AprX
MSAPRHDFLRASLDRYWELREREGRSHELRRQLERLLEADGPRASREELRELLALMLYYGTALDVGEIASLRRSHLEPAEMGRYRVHLPRRGGAAASQVLPAEPSTVLRMLLAAQPDDVLFPDGAGRPLSDSDLFDLVQRHASGLLLGGAAAEPAFLDHPVVLPTPTRLGAHARYTGRGVTIAFIDSGFHAHPDLCRPRERIKAYVDLTGQDRRLDDAHDDAWHGTMTTVACAGNGYLSNGLYRGIAREADLVLVAIGRKGRILPPDIVRALDWVLENRQRLGIRVVNVSLGADAPQSFRHSAIDEAAELLVASGVVVVAAAGNDPLRPSVPPANAPSVITVGGLVDKNLPHEMTFAPYRSQYGVTVDGLLKPELCAPGALVAAPILPGTPVFKRARALYFTRALPDDELRQELARHPELGIAPEGLDDDRLRARLEQEIRTLKLVGPHFQHVDGTSFAAPIVASVVAQMLEAAPSLSPHAVREMLVHTARSIPHIPRERQGYGLVQALDAVQAAESPDLPALLRRFDEPRVHGARATFRFPTHEVQAVSVSGTFNQWDLRGLPLQRASDGAWEVSVDLPLPGRHAYKFIVGGRYWVEDVQNPRTEPDGYGGVNSVFETAEHGFGAELDGSIFTSLHDGVAGEERTRALSALDFCLGLPNAAWNTSVQAYHRRTLEHALGRLREPGPARGVEIVQLYNCGVVLRSATARVGIDVVTGRHVWGVNWPLPDGVLSELADSIDVLLVTQRLPDHLDLDLVRALLERGRTVVVPEEVRTAVAEGCVGMPAGALRTFDVRGAGVEVKGHRARHWWDPDGHVVQRTYEVTLGGVLVHHLADHDHTRFLDLSRPPDVLLAVAGRVSDADPRLSTRGLLQQARPRLLVPTHLAELGRPGYGGADGYDAVVAHLDGCAVPWRLLTWGEVAHTEGVGA